MRKIKRILAAVSAAAVLAASTVTVNAYPQLLTLYYEAGSEEYMECVSDMTKVPYEEKLGVLLNSALGQKWYSVYYAPGRSNETFIDDKYRDTDKDIKNKYFNVNEYMIEIEAPDNNTGKDLRRFLGVELYFNQLYEMDGKGGELSNSLESMNAFLKENGYDAKIELDSLNANWIDKLYITYGEDIDTEGMTDILYALYKKFDLEPSTYGTFGSLVIAGAALNDARADDMLFGDANGDKKCDVRDCACIAEALANGDTDSLPPVADYNRDGKKNVRDAAAIANGLAVMNAGI